MSWASGLILWMLCSVAALWVVGEVMHRFNTPEQQDDWLARRKRRITRNGYKSKMGVK